MNARRFQGSELLLSYVETWRFWKIDRDDKGLCLRSVIVAQNWPKGELLKARCYRTQIRNQDRCRHDAVNELPTFRGECGIYGYRTATQAYNTSLHEDLMKGRVIGTVALAGRGIDHDFGYRAAYAYPLTLVAAGCSKGGHIISLNDACLVEREDKTEAGLIDGDSTYTISCQKHLEAQPANFDWVGMLLTHYGIKRGMISSFLPQ